MFTAQTLLRKRVETLEKEINNINKSMQDTELRYINRFGESEYTTSTGLLSNVKTLIKENDKLKAIVAELCDYVYKEDK